MTHDFSIYARTLTIADSADLTDGPPAHVANRILLDGKQLPGVLHASIDFGKGEATVVTLEVLAEHVTAPEQKDDGTFSPGFIGDHPVLTPRLDHYPWEEFNLLADLVGSTLSSDYPLVHVGVVRCHFYIARVVFEGSGDDLMAVAEATEEPPIAAPLVVAGEEPIEDDPDWDGTEPIIVGLSGYAGSGKDTAAKALLWTGEWTHASFAAKLKAVAYALNPLIPVHRGQLGYDEFNVADTSPIYVRYAEYLDKVGHEQGKFGNPEVRALLQRVGTDAGREVLGEDVWVDAAMRDLPPGNVVFTDCRFPNEAAAIQAAGGYVIRIERPGTAPVNPHPSETALDDFPFDARIINDGSQQDLHRQLKAAIAMLEQAHADPALALA